MADVPEPLPDDRDRDVPLSAEELVAAQGVKPIVSVDELATDLWADDDVDEFIADVRRARHANVA